MTQNKALAIHLNTILVASAPLATLVGTRIYHAKLGRSTVKPYVIFRLGPDRPKRYIGKSANIEPGHVWRTIEIMLRSVVDPDTGFGKAHDIDEAVRAAVQVGGTQGGYHIARPILGTSFETDYKELDVMYPSVVTMATAIVMRG